MSVHNAISLFLFIDQVDVKPGQAQNRIFISFTLTTKSYNSKQEHYKKKMIFTRKNNILTIIYMPPLNAEQRAWKCYKIKKLFKK